MVDHEGHVKAIEWQYQQTGPHEGALFPVVKDYQPGDAPPDLLGAAAAAVQHFVTKVEAFLRFAGLPFSKCMGFPDPASSPKSQLPYLQRGRQRIGDSNFIIQHLVSSGAAPTALLHPADPAAAATAVAITRLCDTDLAAAIVYERWVDDEGWKRCRHEMLGPYRLLWPVRAVVARMARKASFVRAYEQGIGRHSDADRRAMVAEELAALAALLGDKPYMFGDNPHAVDASVYGILDQMAAAAMNPRLAALVAAHPNLVAYRERIRERFFGPDQQEVQWVDGGGAQAGSKVLAAGDADAVATKKEE